MELDQECFGPLWQYVEDDSITDIDYNGECLWFTNIHNERFQVPRERAPWLTPAFVERFSQHIANLISVQFNRLRPELEAETPNLRVTIIHENAARSGRCISIRKTPPVVRMKAENLLEEGYLEPKILALLINCVRAGLNMTYCGMPGAGKTECLKFFTSYIPGEDRVITIEDTMEIRYSATNPGKDCIELRVDDKVFDYTAAIKASLRMNPRWIMLSEARSREVKYLMEALSTGVRGMTTIHTDHVKNIPDRILNMMENRLDADRLENDIYRAIDVGLLIRRQKTSDGKSRRILDQLCFFLREDGENHIHMVVSQGKWNKEPLPEPLLKQFARAGVADPFRCPVLEEELKAKGVWERWKEELEE